MTQASVNIVQQFIDGGVVPADLSGQSAASKKYVDDQLAIRDQSIAAAANAAGAAQSDIDDHESSTRAHAAENITYSGRVSGSNVKQAIDNTDSRIDNIVAQAGNDNTEIVDARGGYAVLGDRLNASDAQLADLAINVKAFGAVGDGSVDDTLSIQSALDMAKTNQGITVIVPPGNYKLTSTLKIYSNTELIMHQGAVFTRHHNTTMMINGDIGGNYPEYSGHGNITIRGGVWDGNILDFPDGWICFGLAHGKNITFEEVEVRDVVYAHAMDINGCSDIIIRRCKFLGYRDNTPDQSRYFSEAIQLTPATEQSFSYFGPYDSTPTVNVLVTECYFGESGTPGTQAWPVGVGNHGAVHDIYCDNIVVDNNYFHRCSHAGVKPFKYKNVTIRNNYFEECVRGVACYNVGAGSESSKDKDGVQTDLPQSGSNLKILNNVFNGGTGDQIYCFGVPKDTTTIAKFEGLYIENNWIDGSAGDTNGIYINWCNNVVISNNQYQNGSRFINAGYCSQVIIKNNNISNVLNEFVFINDPSATYNSLGFTNNWIIEGNVVYSTGRTGIFVQYCKGFIVAFNIMHAIATETDNTRSAITVGATASNGTITKNRVTMESSGNQSQYGIWVTTTSSNVQVFDNDVQGKTARVKIDSASSFDGFYIHTALGTRYKVTIDAGSLTVIEG